ncbi:fimbrial protein [Symbiopectobacterium purcellii]|uniref:Fimbrial protein n=1 Tax=Symbiopectobacterium purcellii TaxID=2871826 RepID=A0ABX9ANU3_9ENTR|nr:fimbrial protein [Symbiopectobacterium purcellii]QZN96344.1 fimbrial protein [Symbiopectobacterium purcellii]QZN96413.1 fimbrial protein [Symbiopectobacterium purcellii]QZN96423.1 fimbrial protein [Symbiopectobacterium purcellii]QZN96461.1 fimbrial protein [Symbiopectobacterium purcellii]
MRLRSLIFGVTAFFCFFLAADAVAAMYVYPMVASLDDKSTRQLTLVSKDDDVQFVKVTLKRIENPGTPQEREVVSDIGGDTGIAVVPSKIALAAGSERIVRIVSMLPPEKETTWRIYFESVDKNTFSSEITGKSSNKDISTRVGVNIIWGVLLHVPPQNIVVSMKYRPGSSEILNDGTVRLQLKEIGICDKQGNCKWQNKVKTIYPDMQVILKDFTFKPGEQYKFKYTDVTTGNVKEITPEALP